MRDFSFMVWVGISSKVSDDTASGLDDIVSGIGSDMLKHQFFYSFIIHLLLISFLLYQSKHANKHIKP